MHAQINIKIVIPNLYDIIAEQFEIEEVLKNEKRTRVLPVATVVSRNMIHRALRKQQYLGKRTEAALVAAA